MFVGEKLKGENLRRNISDSTGMRSEYYIYLVFAQTIDDLSSDFYVFFVHSISFLIKQKLHILDCESSRARRLVWKLCGLPFGSCTASIASHTVHHWGDGEGRAKPIFINKISFL